MIGLIYVQAVRENIPRERRESARQVLVAFRRALLPLLTPVIILGGILGGLVTPSEAGMIGVIYALILGVFVYRELKPRDLMPILVNTASMSGMILLLVGTASLLSWIFAAERVPGLLANLIMKLSSSSAPFLLITIAVFVLFGAFLEGLPALIIFTPILFPILSHFADIVPLHYGIIMITSLGIGLFLPPMGIGFLIAGVPGAGVLALLTFFLSVIPVGPPGTIQTLWFVEKHGDQVQSRQVLDVQFVPLTGERY